MIWVLHQNHPSTARTARSPSPDGGGLTIGFLALLLFPAIAAAQVLDLPVACTIGKQCLVQKLFDHQQGEGRRDYRCGTHTTEEHDGIDIRVRTLADMRAGVAVLAAADGIVLRVRDGEPDVSVLERGTDAVKSRMAGNGVVIAHADGSETQYSHLRQGSVAVKPGQTVKRGDVLGLIGMSGNAEFPHLHFELRRAGTPIDPFTGDGVNTACEANPKGLWSPEARQALSGPLTAVISSGFADAAPRAADARSGALDGRPMRPDRPLVFWVDVMGAKAGDVQRFEIIGTDGATITRQDAPVDTGGLVWFAFHGKQAPPGGWRKGRYTARYALLRGGQLLTQSSNSVEIRP